MIEIAERPASADLVALQHGNRPRLGFLGVGWMGRHRMQAVARAGIADIVGVADPVSAATQVTAELAPEATYVETLEELFELDLDGIVIATPSGQHAEQAVAALERGLAVFCQKPLGRSLPETRWVLHVARCANRLLGVDFSYRYTAGMRAIRRLIENGALGEVYAIEMLFHNARSPEKNADLDPALSGGGCLIDLGTSLVDLALWCTDFPEVVRSSARLLSQGAPVPPDRSKIEDYAAARIQLGTGTVVQLSCSWNSRAEGDPQIEAQFLGTQGGACFRNVNGSLVDFVAEQSLRDRTIRTLAEPPDDWEGRAVIEWTERLARSPQFNPEVEHLTSVASTLDKLYQLNS